MLIENVQGYVYLEQNYSLKEKNKGKEIQRRIMGCWTAYTKDLDTDQTSTEQTCGRTDQMERSMLNITYKDRRTNIWVRERRKVIDIINIVGKIKWSWAGHINRLKDDRWTSHVTTWRP